MKDLTYYLISGPESDECVKSLGTLLNSVSQDQTQSDLHQALFRHPLEAHVLLSKIFCESSQGFINAFRQSMFAQVDTTFCYYLLMLTVRSATSRG